MTHRAKPLVSYGQRLINVKRDSPLKGCLLRGKGIPRGMRLQRLYLIQLSHNHYGALGWLGILEDWCVWPVAQPPFRGWRGPWPVAQTLRRCFASVGPL